MRLALLGQGFEAVNILVMIFNDIWGNYSNSDKNVK